MYYTSECTLVAVVLDSNGAYDAVAGVNAGEAGYDLFASDGQNRSTLDDPFAGQVADVNCGGVPDHSNNCAGDHAWLELWYGYDNPIATTLLAISNELTLPSCSLAAAYRARQDGAAAPSTRRPRKRGTGTRFLRVAGNAPRCSASDEIRHCRAVGRTSAWSPMG